MSVLHKKLSALIGENAECWLPNVFYRSTAEAGTFFLIVETQEPVRDASTIEYGKGVSTAVFAATPVWWPHSDGQKVVLAWRLRPRLPVLRSGERYIACRRPGFSKRLPSADSLAVPGIAPSSKEARLLLERSIAKLPEPKVVAILHGLTILEVGDAAGVAIVSKNVDLKI